MKTIAIVIAENAVASSITDTLRLFDKANELLQARGRKKIFDVSLVGFSKEIFIGSRKLFFLADKTPNEITNADLIIIPALTGDVIKSTQLNRHYFPWLIKQYKQGTEVASYCIGAFILAATGLLKGKKCATHWMYSNEFRFYYPDVTLVDDKIITEQNGIYTSGGGTSYWNLLLFLLEKYTDREIVIAITKFFLLDIQRTSQASFMMFRGQKEHGDVQIKAIQEYIETNFREKFNVADIALKFSIVRRTLERRFKNATKNSIVEYIQRIKVEAAKKELEMGRKTINEIMWGIGYSDMKTFRDLFLKTTALTPNEYRNKYNRDNE